MLYERKLTSKLISMADDRPETPKPFVSAYLKRPVRKLKGAPKEKDVPASQSISVPPETDSSIHRVPI